METPSIIPSVNVISHGLNGSDLFMEYWNSLNTMQKVLMKFTELLHDCSCILPRAKEITSDGEATKYFC